MSNTPSSPVGLSIQRSALLFVVLVLVLGALLLAANSIDPRASQRPGINYTPWTSPDGLLSLEYPKGWTITSNKLTHQFVSDDKKTGILVRLWRTDQINQPGVSANMTPEELIKTLNVGPNAASAEIKPVSAGNLKGSAIHQTITAADQQGTSTPNGVDFWILRLDPAHILVASAQYPESNRAQSQAIFEHMMGTVQVPKLTDAINAIDTAVPTATATPTSTLTHTPTPTFTNTPTSTYTNTPTKTNTPTPTATNTPTPTATQTNTPTATFTSTPQPTATFTNTPAPTNTTAPSATPAPSDTPMSTATATPTAA